MNVKEAIKRAETLVAFLKTLPRDMSCISAELANAMGDIPNQPCVHLQCDEFTQVLSGQQVQVVDGWSSQNDLLWRDCDGVTLYRLRNREDFEPTATTETV